MYRFFYMVKSLMFVMNSLDAAAALFTFETD